ncbi:MAG: MBL fold metallo-hydrolase [Dehalococcoidia bacterium]
MDTDKRVSDEIIPGVYRLRLPLPFTPLGEAPIGQAVGEVNIYLINGDNGWLQIDAGWNDPQTLEAYMKGLGEIGIYPENVSYIVVTHVHLDHFGLAGKLKEISGANLFLHQADRYFLDPGGKDSSEVVREVREWLYTNGTPDSEIPSIPEENGSRMKFISPVLPDLVFFTGELGAPDIFLSGGETFSVGEFELEVLWMPGHSPGHVCLYEKTRKLFFSGDHILENITPEIGFNPASSSNDPLGNYLNSLRKTQQLDVNLVLPAHGDEFTGLHTRIDELFAHHEERKEAICQIVAREAQTAYSVATGVNWIPQNGGVGWDQLDRLNRRMALMETLAHLRVLEIDNRVKSMPAEGRDLYSAM